MNKIYELLLRERKLKYKGGLYHQTQISFAYNSNKIEGCELTEDQTRYLYETHSIKFDGDVFVRTDDIISTNNHFYLFNYMLNTVSDKLSEDMIKKYHEILMSGTEESKEENFAVGDYKREPNMIGLFTETTSPENVSVEIGELLKRYNAKEKIDFNDIIDFHYRFESIHPFQNGNGRVGRMIMFKECLRNNILPFVIGNRYKQFYYLGLSENDNSSFRLIETCAASQDDYARLCKYFRINISDMERSLPKKMQKQMQEDVALSDEEKKSNRSRR